MIRPLGKAVVGSPVGLVDEASIIVKPFEKPKTPLAIDVLFVGPKCQDVRVGDQVVLEPYGGAFVTLVDDNGEAKQFVACEEAHVLFIVE